MRMLPWPRRSAALFALVLFILLFSTSFAGRQCSFSTNQETLRQHTEASSEAEQKDEAPPDLVRARMLNVKTNDYGRYDPAPSMEKPHSKLIPN